MKFKVEQQVIANGLQQVQRAASARATVPVLSGVLVETVPQGLALSATDQEIGIRVTVGATVASEGAFVFPSRLGDIVRKIPFGEIEFEVDNTNNTAAVTWERSRFVIHGYPGGEFPSLPEPPPERSFTLTKADLRRLVRQTGFAVSHDDSRPVFTGILLAVEDSTLRFVATDGFRLAIAEGSVAAKEGDTEADLIVPGRGLAEVARVLGEESEGTIRVTLGQNRVFFDAERERVICRLIEGQFPPYKTVIPQQFVSGFTCATQGLLDACERASLIARDVGQAIKLQISGTTLVLSASTPELGNVREELPVQSRGDALEIAFNPRYLIDGLRNMDTEKMNYEFTGPLSPSCMRPDGEEAGAFTYVVLPMRLA